MGAGRLPSGTGPEHRPAARITEGRNTPGVPGVMPWGRLAEPRGGESAMVRQRLALGRHSPSRSPWESKVIVVDYPTPSGGDRLSYKVVT